MNKAIKAGLWKKDGNNGSYYSGRIEVGGQEYWVNLYKNDRKTSDNHPDLNLQLKPKENSGRAAATRARQDVRQLTENDPGDELPW